MRTLRMLAGGEGYGCGFWRDKDGFWSVAMDEDEVLDLTVDWTGWLEGDTIATSAFAPDGVTENSESNTTTSSTCWLTAPDDPRGQTVLTVTTAAGRTKQLTIRVYRQAS